MNKIELSFRHTLISSYIGFIIQAIVNNFIPLLFVTFQYTYGISIDKITLLISVNFIVQLFVDLAASKFADNIGYKKCVIFAHIMVAIGLGCLALLPNVFSDFAFVGLVISVVIYAIGGGLLEVVLSPVVEACPTKKKEAAMSLLHSFYCWGSALVILVSTGYFWLFGIENWRYLAIVWMLLPLLNVLYFSFVPVMQLKENCVDKGYSGLLKQKIFWLLMIVMLCAGATELIIGQWSSSYAEIGLNLDKSFGDLAGPFVFVVLMGMSRVLFSLLCGKVSIKIAMLTGGLLCVCSYLLIALASSPMWSLVGCGLTGFGVGVLWPGTYSLAAEKIPNGGTRIFGLLALSGDVGCALGPALVGIISAGSNNNLSTGILVGVVFPAILIIALLLSRTREKTKIKQS